MRKRQRKKIANKMFSFLTKTGTDECLKNSDSLNNNDQSLNATNVSFLIARIPLSQNIRAIVIGL